MILILFVNLHIITTAGKKRNTVYDSPENSITVGNKIQNNTNKNNHNHDVVLCYFWRVIFRRSLMTPFYILTDLRSKCLYLLTHLLTCLLTCLLAYLLTYLLMLLFMLLFGFIYAELQLQIVLNVCRLIQTLLEGGSGIKDSRTSRYVTSQSM